MLELHVTHYLSDIYDGRSLWLTENQCPASFIKDGARRERRLRSTEPLPQNRQVLCVRMCVCVYVRMRACISVGVFACTHIHHSTRFSDCLSLVMHTTTRTVNKLFQALDLDSGTLYLRSIVLLSLFCHSRLKTYLFQLGYSPPPTAHLSLSRQAGFLVLTSLVLFLCAIGCCLVQCPQVL